MLSTYNIPVLSGSLGEKPNKAVCPSCQAPRPESIDDDVVFADDISSKKIVHCRMCHLQFPGEKCMKGYGRCMATTEEACTVGKIFKTDGSFWLTFMGCLKNCANVRNIPWSIYRVSFTCCRGYDLCNENL
ncbi:prostate and testis expressed protein 1 isoform X3 [Octodon degus]|uniref:Prostate and testis expressed protein 1 isoform X3 n=1 Tax=Octodon degus TaxID=10160 RepID=A0A6P6DB31_OCTDE|nr:prostate and testis expressed protein 1 isoform X3 [Octodon degus]